MGDGFAVNPIKGRLVSPVDGIVKSISNKKHLIVITSTNDREVFIHIGIDTIALNGEGFTCYIKVGEKVEKGQLLIKFDLDILRKEARSIISPIIFTNLNSNEFIYFPLNKQGKISENIIKILKKIT